MHFLHFCVISFYEYLYVRFSMRLLQVSIYTLATCFLQTCILVNQNLLNAFNASHDSLNNICVIARKHEMYAKYTDIGNGRYAYVWCPRHADEPCKHMELISKELETHGFDVTETNLARNGVKIEMMT